jgi:hypothetical protein
VRAIPRSPRSSHTSTHGTLSAFSRHVRREDSNALEARLRERDRDQAVIGNRVIERDAFLWDPSSEDAEVPEQIAAPLSLLQDEQVNAEAQQQAQFAGSQEGNPDDDLFAALGEALDEIEGEERADTKEYMAPTKDALEVIPAIETMYKRMTRSFIGSTDPLLAKNPRPIIRPGQLVTAVDKSLEELLTISLSRARHALEQRKACDGIRTHRRFG